MFVTCQIYRDVEISFARVYKGKWCYGKASWPILWAVVFSKLSLRCGVFFHVAAGFYATVYINRFFFLFHVFNSLLHNTLLGEIREIISVSSKDNHADDERLMCRDQWDFVVVNSLLRNRQLSLLLNVFTRPSERVYFFYNDDRAFKKQKKITLFILVSLSLSIYQSLFLLLSDHVRIRWRVCDTWHDDIFYFKIYFPSRYIDSNNNSIHLYIYIHIYRMPWNIRSFCLQILRLISAIKIYLFSTSIWLNGIEWNFGFYRYYCFSHKMSLIIERSNQC